MYCDNFIKKQTIKFCTLNKNKEEFINTLLTTFNSYYYNLNKEDWHMLFDLCDNGNISIVQIEEKMFHYNIDDIKNLYSNYKIKQKDVKISHSVNIYKQK